MLITLEFKKKNQYQTPVLKKLDIVRSQRMVLLNDQEVTDGLTLRTTAETQVSTSENTEFKVSNQQRGTGKGNLKSESCRGQ